MQFHQTYKLKTLRQANIKNCPNYFFISMTNIKNFDANLLGISKIVFTNTDSVAYKNLDGVNSLYLVFNNVDAYLEENNEDKYLIFTLTNKGKEALEKYTELWCEILIL